MTWATRLVCSATGEPAPLDEPAFLSPAGKPYLVEYALDPEDGRRWAAALAGRPWTLWRYRELLPVADPAAAVDLGEGGTPLVPLRRTAPPGVRVWIKDESGNPTGSFKARGLSLAVNRARELGAPGVELPSAGNAALALAAYGAAAGLPVRVALPADTPREIAERCRLHGAEVLSGGRTLVESAERLAAEPRGYWNLSTLKEPYRVEGKKTMGLELAEQFGCFARNGDDFLACHPERTRRIWVGEHGLDGRLPDWIFYPTGGGTGIVGMWKAFDELERLGLIGTERPRLVAVQMTGCAPIVRAFERGEEAAEPWADPETEVYGLRVPKAIGDFLILRALRESGGRAMAVEEGRLAGAARRAAREEGLLVGPEGAACLVALEDLAAEGAFAEGARVVVFQTGHPANYGWRP
ncbi:MAG TPA: pyridoxal-phosphate dependent enzyme [Thermoanaerobaculia bacterium]|nr:pyridoxal-phosphate dependent enzyme [Thermoanaerobaculia bacterium]